MCGAECRVKVIIKKLRLFLLFVFGIFEFRVKC